MTEATRARIPAHLLKYVVDQNYARYTPEDQATWRFIMRQLKVYLGRHAHPAYAEGIRQTGITIDEIPRITDVDAKLERYGWGAVPVSGFIPPAAFMEFQSIGVLPVASDMRTLAHWLYTPAPDIVHEAAGHAPLLIHEGYSEYLRRYGEVARHTIISQDDLDQYEAIRVLSDLKEDPRSRPDEIVAAERRLDEVNSLTSFTSEATLLSRMNWWTAEYGLIGDLKSPRLYGAGLLSSVGESRSCLGAGVRKLPLTVDCVEVAYNITEPQPQLFVTPDFEHLSATLEQLADRLSYRRGGTHGLDEAVRARTVNSVTLDSGVQISGRLKGYLKDAAGRPCYLRFEGASQLSVDYAELAGQGRARHAHGYSTPVGLGRGFARPLHEATPDDFNRLGLTLGATARLEFTSGVVVAGRLTHVARANDRPLYLTWADCRVTRGDELLFDPAWGEYDMALGAEVTSVFGGPADRARFGDGDDFTQKRVPARAFTADERARLDLYQSVRDLRSTARPDPKRFAALAADILRAGPEAWLPGLELLEVGRANAFDVTALAAALAPERAPTPEIAEGLRLGLALE